MKRASILFVTILSLSLLSNPVIARGNQQVKKASVLRFDEEIYSYLKASDSSKGKKISDTYPALLPAFAQTTTGQSGLKSSDALDAIKKYFAHPSLLSIYNDALGKYADVSKLENELDQINTRLQGLYPRKTLPQLVFHISGFKENIIVVENQISISIDKYLGKDYPIYQQFFPAYERLDMTSKSLLRDYLKAWIISDITNKTADKEQTLLASMIQEGKTLYMLSLLLPDYQAQELMGYSTQQMQWCSENEKQVWRQILKQNHLYTKDFLLISKYLADTEFTAPISEQTPGRIATWIGFQIVSQYTENTKASLQDIFAADAQTIFKGSKYKP